MDEAPDAKDRATDDYFVVELEVAPDYTLPIEIDLSRFKGMRTCDVIQYPASAESGAPSSRKVVTTWVSETSYKGQVPTDLQVALKLPPLGRTQSRIAFGRGRPTKSDRWRRIKTISTFAAGLVVAYGYWEFLDKHLFKLFSVPTVHVSTTKSGLECPVGPLDNLDLSFVFRNLEPGNSCVFQIVSVELIPSDPSLSGGLVLTSPAKNPIPMPLADSAKSETVPLRGSASKPGRYAVVIRADAKAGRFGRTISLASETVIDVWPAVAAEPPVVETVSSDGTVCMCRLVVKNGNKLPRGFRAEIQLAHPEIQITDILKGSVSGTVKPLEGGEGASRIASLNWQSPPIEIAMLRSAWLFELKSLRAHTRKEWEMIVKAVHPYVAQMEAL